MVGVCPEESHFESNDGVLSDLARPAIVQSHVPNVPALPLRQSHEGLDLTSGGPPDDVC